MRISWKVDKKELLTDLKKEANLLVTNLDPKITQGELYHTFSLYGDVISCQIAEYATGESRGYGYVQFKTKEEAERAISEQHDKEIKARIVKVQKHHSFDLSKREDKFTSLFVRGLPDDCDDEGLKKLFEEYVS